MMCVFFVYLLHRSIRSNFIATLQQLFRQNYIGPADFLSADVATIFTSLLSLKVTLFYRWSVLILPAIQLCAGRRGCDQDTPDGNAD
jgi:hypothetical protein